MAAVRRTAWYTGLHAATDFCCAFFLFRAGVSASQWVLYLLLYNFLAFAMQMPLGLICDKLDRNAGMASLGLLLVACCCFLERTPFLLAAAAGIGNALFHLGGGLDVMNGSRGKAGGLGVFVSSGALGLYFGTAAGSLRAFPSWAAGLALLALAAVTPWVIGGRRPFAASGNAPVSLPRDPPRACGAAALLLAVVVIRSYLGWNTGFIRPSGTWAFYAVLASALGKAAGGFVRDVLGTRRAAAVQLGLAAVLFLFSNVPLCGVIALFLFNMTMPVTLYMSMCLFSHMKGFGFGLLTFGLFLGFLPSALGLPAPLSSPVGLCVLTLVSLGLLLAATVAGKDDA